MSITLNPSIIAPEHTSAPSLKLPRKVKKRNGAYANFDVQRIRSAFGACYDTFTSEEPPPLTPVSTLVTYVENSLHHRFGGGVPSVEDVQDIAEMALVSNGEFEAAHRYMRYRELHAKDRIEIPEDVLRAFEIDAQYFPTQIQRFQFYDKYSRFNWDLMRRETWPETVDRVVNYYRSLSENKLENSVYERIHDFMLHQKAMSSMRCLAMAGPAAERNSMAIYNCSFLFIDSIDALAEIMLVSLAGCGVGYSVEREHVEKFPRIKRQTGEKLDTYVIDDSAEGWAEAVRFGLQTWVDGKDVDFDPSEIELHHPMGTPLKIKGGRASGSGPLMEVLAFCREKILSRQGSFLRPLDTHDLSCVIGGAAVSGGVRRTALIALFDYDDHEMRTCKDGAKLEQNPWRWNANNSAVWPDTITQLDLMHQFTDMFDNRRGEPGIFSREAANRTKPQRRSPGVYGSNPCGEILLNNCQFCNLSIAVAREDDTLESLAEKVEVASIIGTIQSLATNFPNMRPLWKENCEKERLLGVDIIGERDCSLFYGDQTASNMEYLQRVAVETNVRIARELDINPSAAVTCNKPGGNSSVFLNASSGMNARWSGFYIRRVRVNTYTPIYKVLKACNVPMDPENGQVADTANTWVAHFPMKSPKGAKTRKDFTALDQCEFWKLNKLHWTEHNPSTTITYQTEEMIPLTQWVWNNKDIIGGLAFLPADNAKYALMPYEEITEEEYERLAAEFPEIDYSLLYQFERTDHTTSAQEVACLSGSCEL